MTRAIAILAFLLFLPSAVLAQSTIFVVRHAERADAGMAAVSGADPDLSDLGRARAESLAAMLKDARITHIFVTEFKRTRQTAEPLATRLRLVPTVMSSKSTPGVAERVKSTPGNVLVVGHSNTVPDILKALGVEEAVVLADSEYDNLFVVTSGASPSLVRLRYR
jgi:2,3-bisphosphoglycerate-dependent phosphoglycerate mutase